ncbi:MAG: Ig-like domain-containing protein, partial [Mariprofundaceae bacterium]|nr:Ig-like domain-containing protein [Mariprofundaceae bacterium]
TTDSYGQATVYVRNSVPESASLTFKDATGSTSFGVPVLFVASTAQQVSLTASPSTASPDGVTPIVVSALVRDAYGVAVPNAIVDFYTKAGTSTILNPTYGSGNANTGVLGNTAAPDFLGFAGRASTQGVVGMRTLTDASGRISISVLDTYGEAIDIYATLSLNGGVNTFNTVTFEQPVSTMTLSKSASSLSASTGSATLRATVLDVNGAPLSGRTVSFTTTGGAVLSGAAATTSATGVATVTLTDAYAETVNVVASIGGINQTQSIVFTPVVQTLSVTISPSNGVVAADGTSVATVLVNAKDANGVPIVGQLLSFADPYGSSALFSVATATTGASGTAQMTVKDPYAEKVWVSVTAGAKSNAASINFTQTNVSLAGSVATPFVADGNNNPVTITVTDQLGNPVANQVFTVTATGSMAA